jgi:hypothetical protein
MSCQPKLSFGRTRKHLELLGRPHGLVIRTLDSFEVRFKFGNDQKINDIKINYKYPDLKPKEKEKSRDDKFGTIDFETYSDGFGNFIVYAASYAYMRNGIIVNKAFYTSPHATDNVVVCLIQDLCRKKFNGFTFYAHNLGGSMVSF